MFRIDRLTNEIDINRGDSATIPVSINQGDALHPFYYELGENDYVFMGIEEPNQPFENAIVKKVIDHSAIRDREGNYLIELESDDTSCLLPGLYYYEIKAKLYRENQYINGYEILTFNNDGTFNLIDTDRYEELMSGTYIYNEEENKYILTDYEENVYECPVENDYLKLNDLYYRKQKDLVFTIIPQTRFIIER